MSVFKDNQGKWVAHIRYTDWQGVVHQRKKTNNKTRKEAIEFERDFINKHSNSADITFENLLEHYFNDCAARLKPTTLANKKFLIKTKILPFFAKKQIQDISIADIRRWQNELLTNPNNYSLTYLKTVHNQMSAIFNFAKKFYNLPTNPAADCGSMGKKHADELHFWTKNEFDEFIVNFEDDVIHKTVFNLLFYSGMREGEMLALTLADFDFNKNTVRINKTYARLNCKDIIQTPKTPKSRRIVVLPQFIMDMVKDYANKIYGLKSTDRLFITNKYNLAKRIQQGCKKSNIQKIRVHDLRHSHASLLIEMGVSPLLISERLGHENVQTTLNTYSHLYPNKDAEIAMQLQQKVVGE